MVRENTTYAGLAQPVDQHLLDLKAKIAQAAKFAEEHTRNAQESYAAHYNLRAKDKQFQEGDQVIILAPENNSKMSTIWLGPGTVIKVKNPHSYLVDLENNNVRHIHANKMRRFVTRVQGCGVVAENDADFGKLSVHESVAGEVELQSVRLKPKKDAHLEESQRTGLLRLLDAYADCFSDKLGLCDVVMLRIVTTPDFVPKQMRPYRVPEVF